MQTPTWMPHETVPMRWSRERAARTQSESERRRHLERYLLAFYSELLYMAQGGLKRVVNLPALDPVVPDWANGFYVWPESEN